MALFYIIFIYFFNYFTIRVGVSNCKNRTNPLLPVFQKILGKARSAEAFLRDGIRREQVLAMLQFLVIAVLDMSIMFRIIELCRKTL